MSPAADRVPNLTLRAIRHELNLSQDELAARIRQAGRRAGEPNDCTKRHVQRWESGQSAAPRPIYRRALESVTGRRYAELGFAGQTAPAVGRRAVLEAGAMAGMLAAVPQLAHLETGRAIGAVDVEALRARTARLRRLDDYLGGADTFRLYAAETEATATLLTDTSYSENTGRALLSLYAEQAQQAGWAAFDAGAGAQAERLFSASLTAARTAGDAPLAGNALALAAYQATSSGRSGVDTAAAAVREAGPHAPGRARALLLQRLAWAHASAGQITAAQYALDLAQDAGAEASDTDTPDWAAWADEREQRIITGRCWSELRRPLRAVPVLESVLAEYEDSHARDKSLYLSWLAGAYLDAGEVEQAAVTTARAVDLAADVASARPAQRTGAILARLTPHRALPAVRELLERAAA